VESNNDCEVNMENRLLSMKEVAEYLGVTTKTLRRTIDMGMPFVKVLGQYRFDLQKVLVWLRELQENEQ